MRMDFFTAVYNYAVTKSMVLLVKYAKPYFPQNQHKTCLQILSGPSHEEVDSSNMFWQHHLL